MTDREDIDMLAAEYVLGTLDDAERTAVSARVQREPALRAAVAEWERCLAPLNAATPALAPRGHVFEKISNELDRRRDPASTNVVSLRQSRNRWRMAALAASVISVVLGGVFLFDRFIKPAPADQFVAVFNENDRQPSFILSINLKTRELTIRSVAAEPQPEKSYQLWIVADELGPGPRSLGLLAPLQTPTRKTLDIEPGVLQSATFGISIEPEGGSPVDRPTGPAIHGRLIPASE